MGFPSIPAASYDGIPDFEKNCVSETTKVSHVIHDFY